MLGYYALFHIAAALAAEIWRADGSVLSAPKDGHAASWFSTELRARRAAAPADRELYHFDYKAWVCH